MLPGRPGAQCTGGELEVEKQNRLSIQAACPEQTCCSGPPAAKAGFLQALSRQRHPPFTLRSPKRAQALHLP